MASQLDIANRVCKKCNLEKSIDQFGTRTVNKDGLNYNCRSCMALYRTNHYFNNEEYRLKRIKDATKFNRKRKYGICDEDFQHLLRAQDNRCAICCTYLDNSKFSLCGQLDHCHITQKIRKILCGQCNTALGLFKDNKDILIQAVNYLSEFK